VNDTGSTFFCAIKSTRDVVIVPFALFYNVGLFLLNSFLYNSALLILSVTPEKWAMLHSACDLLISLLSPDSLKSLP